MVIKNIEDIINRREVLFKTLENIENEIKTLPEGGIIIKKQNNRSYYYQTGGKPREKYLTSKENDLINLLLRKDYLKKALKAVKQELEGTKMILTNYPAVTVEDVYDQLPEERKRRVKSIILGDDEFSKKWIDEPYDKKPIKKGSSSYLTLKGEYVRSKSELIIADRLWVNGIPYKYECPILVDGEIIHPDFTILRIRDRKIIYHEHCGMIDDADYSEKLADRINKYSRAGIVQGDRLFFSFETAKKTLDVSMIDRLIDTHFR